MSPVLAADAHVLPSSCESGRLSVEEQLEAKFHRLLEADRNSPLFAALWEEIDAYLTERVEAERAC